MEKFSKYGWWVLIVIPLAIAAGIYITNEEVRKETQERQVASGRNYREEFSCNEEANVWQTECIIEKLDKASAIREWKQRKIEMLKHPEINTYEFSFLTEDTAKLKNWREGFEESRDKQCVAENSFRGGGSGVPGLIAECELNYEISALEALDKLYYERIMYPAFGSRGISDFEPTEKDIEKLVKDNKTERDCIWADDPACK